MRFLLSFKVVAVVVSFNLFASASKQSDTQWEAWSKAPPVRASKLADELTLTSEGDRKARERKRKQVHGRL